MMKQNQLIILDVHGLIDESKGDSIRRHLKYDAELLKISKGKMQILIISKWNMNSKHSTSDKSANNLSTLKLTSKEYISKCTKVVRNSGIGSVLVCGDPWKSFYTGLAIKLLCRSRIPIQVQLHADIYDDSYTRRSLRNQIKRKIAYLSLWSADSIRTVSKLQTKNLIKCHPKFQNKIVQASVPLNSEYLESKPRSLSGGQITVGILGRMESDRGLDRLLKLSEFIVENAENIRFVLAGNGKFVIQEPVSSRTLKNDSIFTFLGELTSRELPDFFNQIDVLLSLAPSESFGRALRESLLAGRPVVAISSSGVTELKEYLNGESVYSVGQEISNLDLIKILSDASSKNVPESVVELIQKEQEESIKALAQSWLDLSNTGSRGKTNDS